MTNTEYLMKALGWQGGTVHQVARSTGLNVMQVLDLHLWEVKNKEAYQHGYHLATFERGTAAAQSRYKEAPDLVCYWRGVLECMRVRFKNS